MLEVAVPFGPDAYHADVLVVRVDGDDVEEILALLARHAARVAPQLEVLGGTDVDEELLLAVYRAAEVRVRVSAEPADELAAVFLEGVHGLDGAWKGAAKAFALEAVEWAVWQSGDGLVGGGRVVLAGDDGKPLRARVIASS